jgi:carbamoyltransferase
MRRRERKPTYVRRSPQKSARSKSPGSLAILSGQSNQNEPTYYNEVTDALATPPSILNPHPLILSMPAILGISAFYHDSAAALVVDGEIVAAAQEERFTRKKHDARLPVRAIEYCLEHAKLSAADVDYVAFYDKPITKFERLLETYLAFAPTGFRSFRHFMPLWLSERLFIPRAIEEALGGKYRGRIVFPEHHESHAASAFFPSPFDEAAILTLDGVGEWSTTCFGVGQGNRIRLDQEIRYPHSLGLLYSAFTYYCGFKVNSGEYKLMGLAPYGDPKYRDEILEHLIDV